MRTATYDAAFIACREPDVVTRKFDEHHIRTLERAARLQQAGVVKYILVSGDCAARYKRQGITPWFGTEADASAKELTDTYGRPAGSILRNRTAQNTIANFIDSAEEIIDSPDYGIDSMLVLTAAGRLARQRFIASKTLQGVVEMDFRSTGPTNDPNLDLKERFALAMQMKYLSDVPDGRAGWDILKATAYEGPTLLPFWASFDVAQQTIPASPDNSILDISKIIDNMETGNLSPEAPDIMDFAANTARELMVAARFG